MPGWSAVEPDTIDPEVIALAKDFAVVSGRIVMPVAAFKRWRRKHQTIKGKLRTRRARDLTALAHRLSDEGKVALDAIAQLCVLAADLLATK